MQLKSREDLDNFFLGELYKNIFKRSKNVKHKSSSINENKLLSFSSGTSPYLQFWTGTNESRSRWYQTSGWSSWGAVKRCQTCQRCTSLRNQTEAPGAVFLAWPWPCESGLCRNRWEGCSPAACCTPIGRGSKWSLIGRRWCSLYRLWSSGWWPTEWRATRSPKCCSFAVNF